MLWSTAPAACRPVRNGTQSDRLRIESNLQAISAGFCCRCRSALVGSPSGLPGAKVGSPRISRRTTPSYCVGSRLARHLLPDRGQLVVEGEKRRTGAVFRPLSMPKLLVTAPTNPSQWRRMRVIWPFVTVVALMLLLGHASLDVMSGLRAFANAESARSRSWPSPWAVSNSTRRPGTRVLTVAFSPKWQQSPRCGTLAPNSPRPSRTSASRSSGYAKPVSIPRMSRASSMGIGASGASGS